MGSTDSWTTLFDQVQFLLSSLAPEANALNDDDDNNISPLSPPSSTPNCTSLNTIDGCPKAKSTAGLS